MIELIAAHIIPAALSLLPDTMDRPGAREMLIAIGLQESRFEHRRQIGGPARGWWQFERGGGVAGVLRHDASKHHAIRILGTLRYKTTPSQVYEALADNDILACVFARLLLYTFPGPLPGPDEPAEGWRQYKDTWRPGRPHRQTWDAFYAQAWST